MNKIEMTHHILQFLTKIGIKTSFCSLNEATFLPGILIDKGQIFIDMEKLAYPGDLLHEAGHLAVLEPTIRANANAEVLGNPGDEISAILWSYAAACEIQLPIDCLFHPNGYKGQSDWLIESLTNETYIGLPMLEWMGMTASKEKAQKQSIAPFPKMIRWLRDKDLNQMSIANG